MARPPNPRYLHNGRRRRRAIRRTARMRRIGGLDANGVSVLRIIQIMWAISYSSAMRLGWLTVLLLLMSHLDGHAHPNAANMFGPTAVLSQATMLLYIQHMAQLAALNFDNFDIPLAEEGAPINYSPILRRHISDYTDTYARNTTRYTTNELRRLLILFDLPPVIRVRARRKQSQCKVCGVRKGGVASV